MKVITRKRIRTVQAKSAAEFDDMFNKISDEMTTTAELKWDGELCVHFIYDEETRIAENVKDEFELRGETYTCCECPHFEKSDDKRVKNHGCRYSKYGAVRECEPACEIFYRELINGMIKGVRK